MTECVFSAFSRFCGAPFLPPAVTRMSFLRSVIVMKPSASIEPTSPERTQPPPPTPPPGAAGAPPGARADPLPRGLLVLVVPGEHGLAANQELALVVDSPLEPRQGG